MKNFVAVNKSTLETYPNVEASPFSIFEVGPNGEQTVVMAVAADGNEQIEKNKFGIGVDFNKACDNLISDLKTILGDKYEIKEF